jgi:hypothetical protein
MSKNLYKYVIFLLILLPTCLSTQAQGISTQTPEIPAQTQESEKDSLRAAFSRYRSQTPQEKLFVHIDRTFYLAGETIWFKVYNIDGNLNKPLSLSGIAYIEVLDKEQHPVLQAKIEITDGKGDGSFRIPLNISSGQFVFRAYTNWMKNFSPDFYFMQPLTILNTRYSSSTASSTSPAYSSSPASPTSPTSSSSPSPSPRLASSQAAAFDIRFFPEGGNLINGLTAIVAFKAISASGKGVPCRGVIIDQNKDTITGFRSARFGMGKFTFTPAKGNTYTALTEIDHRVIRQELPAAYDQGYAMQVDNSDEHRLRIIVHVAGASSGSSSSSGSFPSSSPLLYLFVHTRGMLKSVQVNSLTNKAAYFYIDKDSLDDGISHITIFDGEKMPVCERLYFKRPRQQLYIDAMVKGPGVTSTHSTQPAFSTRKKISVDLSTTAPSGLPIPANLSMSVFLIDSLQSIPGENILSYLLLGSDLKGRIDSLSYYFSETGPEVEEALDNLMLTQGWTRFRWEELMKNKQPYFEFLPETDGPIINGKVTDRRTGLPVPQVNGYLSVPGKTFRLSTAISRSDGNIYFHLDNFHGTKELIVQTNSQTDSNDRIDIANPFSDQYSYLPLPDSLYPQKFAAQLLYRSINSQAENAYRSALKNRFQPVLEDTIPFYGQPDRQYHLDDYTRFTTMEEVIQEFVDNVHVRRQSGNVYFRVRNALFNLFFDDDPLLLIDGVPVFNGDKMVAMDPLKIERVDVVSHRYFLGPSVSDGIVSFKSYDGQLAGYELDPNAVAIQYNGLSQQREFYAPVYETDAGEQSTIPDFRNQLLWSPEITTDTAGKKQLTLYTSDLTGNYVLFVQGMTGSGLAGYSLVKFSVHTGSLTQ